MGKMKKKKRFPCEELATRNVVTGETEHPMGRHFAWFGLQASQRIADRLEARAWTNETTARMHADPAARIAAQARAQAYRTASFEVAAELSDPRVIARLSLVWWIKQWSTKR